MVALAAFALAGAARGLGDSIVERARQRREEALAAMQREQELSDRDAEWGRDDRLLGDRNAREDAILATEYGREDAQTAAEWGREDAQTAEERRREDDRIGRTANVYESLFGTESGGSFDAANDEGYVGRSQFGQARLDDWANANGTPRVTTAQFRADPDLQRDIEQWHFGDINRFIDENGLAEFEGQTVGGVPITRSGMIAMAHLGGSNGMKRFLESGGSYDPQDSNGTNLSDYARTHGGLSTDMSDVWQVLADPETPASAREDIQRGLGIGAAAATDYEGMIWVDNGDGTETRMGQNPATGNYEPVMGPNGQPLTQRQTRTAARAEDIEASGGLEVRMGREIPSEAVPAVLDKVEQLMLEEPGLSEDAAYQRTRDAMVFERIVEEDSTPWLPGGKSERRERVTGRELGTIDPLDPDIEFTGEFEYGALRGATGSGDSTSETGTGNTPPADPTMPGEPGAPVRVSTQAEYEALPPGTRYIDPEGQVRTKR